MGCCAACVSVLVAARMVKVDVVQRLLRICGALILSVSLEGSPSLPSCQGCWFELIFLIT